jgi:hypothetical protein
LGKPAGIETGHARCSPRPVNCCRPVVKPSGGTTADATPIDAPSLVGKGNPCSCSLSQSLFRSPRLACLVSMNVGLPAARPTRQAGQTGPPDRP